jgi:E3 ubiquitin-protein ligase MYCBP2
LNFALKIFQFSVGHDAQHALILGDDGTVFFVGTAKRGEDGDQSKARRQPKPVKPKRFARMEGLNVILVSSIKSHIA